MEVVRTVAELRAGVARWRKAGARVGLVPTMGAIHEGHLALLRLARSRADRVVATIFVNPTQFAPGEDLASYPRDEAGDLAKLAAEGTDLVFIPSVAEMYPEGFSTEVRVRGITECLCGPFRPGHFEGVALVVTKLLNQAGPDIAVFGEKDWQQLLVIRRLARDLDIPTEIVGAPTVREEDGLAMSSRNRYLGPAERRIAGSLNRVLRAAAARIARGAPVAAVMAEARAALEGAGFDAVDYVECREAETLAPVEVFDPARPARVFAAVRLGRARLIDNLPVERPPEAAGRGGR